MQDRPSLDELIASVRDFLAREVVPTAADSRLRFRALVAANVLAIVGREMQLEAGHLAAEHERLRGILGEGVDGVQRPEDVDALRAAVGELTANLADEIRSGVRAVSPGDAVWRHVRQTVVEKLRVANPAYLERTGRS